MSEAQAPVHELSEIFALQRAADHARAQRARVALMTLIGSMSHKTGQSYKLRSLLYSLWNGQPASLLDVVHLDRALRTSLLEVIAAFGSDEFFYDEISGPLKSAGLFDWFTDEYDHQLT